MRTEKRVATPGSVQQLIDVATEYAIIVYPFVASVSLFALGLIFQATGLYVEAGVSAAIGLIICAITTIVYVLFWSLGRYGH